MLNVTNVNLYRNVNFKGAEMSSSTPNLIRQIDALKDVMIQCEKEVTGYVSPEVKMAIYDKITNLKLKARCIGPQKEKMLVTGLQKLIKDNSFDITQTYLAIGDFEKTLSDN